MDQDARFVALRQSVPRKPGEPGVDDGLAFPDRAVSEATGEVLDRALRDLQVSRSSLAALSEADRLELVEGCLHGTMLTASEWVRACCEAKGIPSSSSAMAEEITAGPLTVIRYLRLLAQTLTALQDSPLPRLPGRVRRSRDGRLLVPVFPTRRLFYDRVLVPGLHVFARMQSSVTAESLSEHIACELRQSAGRPARVALVLGAGNVSSIPATDALMKLFAENRLVLLKLSPVNDYLGPIFEQAFTPAVRAGYLRIIYGGAEIGERAALDPRVEEVHLTGSVQTHERLVWGSDASERQQRRRDGRPRLAKPITSELGNVSPWIIVPGRYSDRQLRFQAENVAASVVNNAGFNCVATRVLVTWRHWPERDRFLRLIEAVLRAVPPRVAYYPGSADRFHKAVGYEPGCFRELGVLPWTLLRDVDPDGSPQLLQQETFVPVLAEVTLDSASPGQFLQQAVEFVNDRLWGTLSAALTVPAGWRRGWKRRWLGGAVARLRYGMVGINHWPGTLYGLASPPWGAEPDRPLDDVQSGRGWVHNAYLLSGVEKTVLEGPLTLLTTPIWFPTRWDAAMLAWETLRLCYRPTLGRLARLLANALKGEAWCGI